MVVFKIGEDVLINTEGVAPVYDGKVGTIEGGPHGEGDGEHWNVKIGARRPYFYTHELTSMRGPW